METSETLPTYFPLDLSSPINTLMLKRLSFLLLLLCSCYIASAQLIVYSFSGDVTLWNGTTWKSIKKAQQLQPTDLIRMEEYAQLCIADNKNKLLLPVQAVGEYPVESLIAQAKRNKNGILKSYWDLMLAILEGKPANEKMITGGHTTRADSLQRDSIDMTIALELHRRLKDNDLQTLSMQTFYHTELQLIDKSHKDIQTGLSKGEDIYPLVTNHSNTPLFVAIVDVDSNGNSTSALPTDIEHMFTSLLVPPHSCIVLPFLLNTTIAGTHSLYLISYPQLFNMENVLALLKDMSASATDFSAIGLAKAVIQVM